MTGSWDWGPAYLQPAIFANHIDELCARCNRGYTEFYRLRKYGTRCWRDQPIARDELVLTAFIADRLRHLARRHRAGKPITRCQAHIGLDRCGFWWAHEVDGHKLCTHHVKSYRRGNVIEFAGDDTAWLNEITGFMRKNYYPAAVNREKDGS